MPDPTYFSYNPRLVNTVYQAMSNGIVMVTIDRPADGTINAYIDENNPPTTVRAYCTILSGNPGVTYFNFPVKQGNFYKVTVDPGYTSYLMWWVSFGTAG